MRFEVNLPGGMDCWALRASGLEPEGFTKLSIAVITDKATPPKTLKCACTLPDASCTASVTVFSFGEPERIDYREDKSGRIIVKRGKRPKTATHLQIDMDDPKVAKAVRKKLEHYSFENDGEGVSAREHCEFWDRLGKTLKREGFSTDRVASGEAQLTRRAIESLMELCRETDPIRRHDIRSLLTEESVAKADRPFVVAWLMKEFESDFRIDDQICVKLWTMATPAIADDLIRLIKDRRYGDQRWVLCLGLAKTKDSRAADVIASILGQGINTRGALEALGKVPAQKYVKRIKEFLKDPDSDIRREAKRTLKKLGFPVETPPPPIHLVKKRSAIPKALEEWSSNLDIEDLNPTLMKLSQCVDSGFGKQEIAEVTGVVDEMKPDQTKTFRFPVAGRGQETELWLVVFMGDIDTPDLAVHTRPDVIERFAGMMPEL